MSTSMIPASSIDAVLSADLTYNPSIHVQTVEIDRTGTSLIAMATDNYVKWFITKQAFLALCRIETTGVDVSNTRYTLDASQGRVLTDASNAILKFSNIYKDYVIPTTEAAIQTGASISSTDPSYVGYVGDVSVNYTRLLYGEDATSASTASATTTSWGFNQTEITIRANWSVSDSSMIVVSADAGVTLGVTKAYNDTAADFIQIKMDGDAFDPHGMNAASADVVGAEIDYASKFDTLTGGQIQSVVSYPTVTISDLVFSKACQQFINADGISRTVTTDSELRDAVGAAIETLALQGIQGENTLSTELNVTVANVLQQDMSKNLTPIIVFDPQSLDTAYSLPNLASVEGKSANGYSGDTHLRSLAQNIVDMTFEATGSSSNAFHSTSAASQFNSIQYSQDGGTTKTSVASSDINNVDATTFRVSNVFPSSDTDDLIFYVQTKGPVKPNGDVSLNDIETFSFTASQIESGVTAGHAVFPASTPAAAPTVGEDYTYTYVWGGDMTEWDVAATYDKDGTVLNSNVQKTANTITIGIPIDDGTATYIASESFTHSTSGVVISNANSVSIGGLGSSPPWTAPTAVDAFTQQSSLTGTYKLVKNKQTRLRLALASTEALHSTVVGAMLHSLTVSVGGAAATALNLASLGVTIDDANKYVDFNYTASSVAEHVFTLKIKKPDSNMLSTNFVGTVSVGDVFEYPTISATAKLAPHDTNDVTVGQALSMQSTFSTGIDTGITASISVSDASGGTPSVASSSVNGADFLYSFTVGNDADHSASITFAMGSTSNTYSWSATGLLTAANDIYSFPNYVAYDGAANGYETGKHLKVDTSSSLVLTFTGGDQLHSDVYASQVSGITYKTGSGGTPVTVPSSDVTINSATGHETITVDNILATAVDDVYVTATLKGPDGMTMVSSLIATVPSSAVKANNMPSLKLSDEWDSGAPSTSLGSTAGLYYWVLNHGISIPTQSTIMLNMKHTYQHVNYGNSNGDSYRVWTENGSTVVYPGGLKYMPLLTKDPWDGINAYGGNSGSTAGALQGFRFDGIGGTSYTNMANPANHTTWTTHVLTRDGNTYHSHDLGETGSMNTNGTFSYSSMSRYSTTLLTDIFRNNWRNNTIADHEFKHFMIFNSILTQNQIETYRTTPPGAGVAYHHFFSDDADPFVDVGTNNMVGGVQRVATKTPWSDYSR